MPVRALPLSRSSSAASPALPVTLAALSALSAISVETFLTTRTGGTWSIRNRRPTISRLISATAASPAPASTATTTLRICGCSARGLSPIKAGIHLHASPQSVLSIGDNLIAGGKPGSNRSDISLGNAERYGRFLNCLVCLHAIGKGSLHAALNRGSGNDDSVLLSIQKQSRIDKLVGPEGAILVIKCCLKAIRACGLVDLVVNREQYAGPKLHPIIPSEGPYFQGHTASNPGVHRRESIFRQSENHRDRLQLGDD